jgi:hypothetical protein
MPSDQHAMRVCGRHFSLSCFTGVTAHAGVPHRGGGGASESACLGLSTATGRDRRATEEGRAR